MSCTGHWARWGSFPHFTGGSKWSGNKLESPVVGVISGCVALGDTQARTGSGSSHDSGCCHQGC